MKSKKTITLLVPAALFFLSGFSALVYQVAWQRILALQSGVGIYSITVIVAAFMAGIGIGSYFGGVGSHRVETRQQSRIVFAIIELAIAGFAALSVYLYYDLMYDTFGNLYRSNLIIAVLHFLSLAVPTTLMGMSLPFLARATVTSVSSASTEIGILYGINIFGAATGAAVTPWLLIRYVGIDGAIYVGSVCNLFAGVGIFAFNAFQPAKASMETEQCEDGTKRFDLPVSESTSHWPFGVWLVLYGISGFIALALEILWFRVVDVAVKSTAYTFGTVLAVYLIGLGIGTLIGIALLRRVSAPHRAFLLCQVAVVVIASSALTLATRLPTNFPMYQSYFHYWSTYEPVNPLKTASIGSLMGLYIFQPAFLFLLPTMFMGMAFVFLQHAVQTDTRTVGRKLGLLQACNICGNVLGSITIGFFALDFLGTAHCFRMCCYLGAIFPIIGIIAFRRKLLFAMCLLLVIGSASAIPDSKHFWQRFHGMASEDVSNAGFFAEDATSVVAVTPVTEKAEFE